MTITDPDLAAVEARGWRVSVEADARGRDYYRARWRDYSRGGHSPAALRACVDATLAAVHAREADAGRVQLSFEVTA